MEILIVSGIFPPDIGGPATFMRGLAADLCRRGHKVEILTLSEKSTAGEDEPYQVTRIPRGLLKPLRLPLTVFAIAGRARRADVILANGLALESVFANFIARKPLIQRVSGDLIWERCHTNGSTRLGVEAFLLKDESLWIGWQKRLRTLWTKRADRIIVPSQYLRRVVELWGIPADRIEVIYNGVSPGSLEDAPPARSGHPFKIISVGRLVPLKGMDDLIRVVSGMSGSTLTIVGEGPESPHLRELIGSLGSGDQVELTGALFPEEVRRRLQAADAFVLNSIHETFPHVVLEAMEAGIPVVATRTGGIPEIVEDGKSGLLVPPENRKALDEALRRLQGDACLRRKLATEGRRTLERFRWEETSRRTEVCLRRTVCPAR